MEQYSRTSTRKPGKRRRSRLSEYSTNHACGQPSRYVPLVHIEKEALCASFSMTYKPTSMSSEHDGVPALTGPAWFQADVK